jgi:hypothetical protein
MQRLLHRLAHEFKSILDNEDASVAGIAYFVIVLFVSLFVYIGLGEFVDRIMFANIALNTTTFAIAPVSQDRVMALGTILGMYKMFPVFGSLLPLAVYALAVAKRRSSGGVGD